MKIIIYSSMKAIMHDVQVLMHNMEARHNKLLKLL